MIHLCLFGVTAGLEVRLVALGDGAAPRFEDSWIEISTRDVSFEGDAEVFRVSRRRVSGQLLTWMGVYRPAREIHLNRSGGYYGAGIWMCENALPGRLAREVILSLADQLRDTALSGGRFVKPLAELNLNQLKLPIQPDKLLSECSPTQSVGGIFPGGSAQAILTDTKSISSIFDWAQRSRTAEFFGSVLVVTPERVVPSDGQLSKKTRTFGSISAAVEFAYAERVRIAEQSETRISQERNELEKFKQRATEELRHAQSQVLVLTKENQRLKTRLVQIQPRTVDAAESYPTEFDRDSWFRRNIMDHWRLIAALVAALIALGVAVVYLMGALDAKAKDSTVQTLIAPGQNSPEQSTALNTKRPDPGAVSDQGSSTVEPSANEQATQTTTVTIKIPDSPEVKPVDLTRQSEDTATHLEAINRACVSDKLEFKEVSYKMDFSKTGQKKIPRDQIATQIRQSCEIEKLQTDCQRKVENIFSTFSSQQSDEGVILLPASCLTGKLKSMPYFEIVETSKTDPPR